MVYLTYKTYASVPIKGMANFINQVPVLLLIVQEHCKKLQNCDMDAASV